jgi:hypothetical protein
MPCRRGSWSNARVGRCAGIVWLKPEGLPRMTDIRLDGPVLAFAIFVAIGLPFCSAFIRPAWHPSRVELPRYTKARGERRNPAAARAHS